MGKLSDKDKMFIALGVGGALFFLFAFLAYMDLGAIDELEKQRKGVEEQTAGYKKTIKDTLPKAVDDLYRKNKAFNFFKRWLPNQKEEDQLVLYDKLESFRIKQKMLPWKNFTPQVIEDIQNPDEENQKDKTQKKPATQVKKPTGLVDERMFTASIPTTLNQLGAFWEDIESHPRFYGVNRINIPNMTKSTSNPDELETTVNLSFISFNLNADTSFEAVVEKLLADKTLLDDARKKKLDDEVKEAETSWEVKMKGDFTWKAPKRNPFDKRPILGNEEVSKPVETGGKKDEPTFVPPERIVEKTDDGLLEEIDKLEQLGKDITWELTAKNYQEVRRMIDENRLQQRISAFKNKMKSAKVDKKWEKQINDLQELLVKCEKTLKEADEQTIIDNLVKGGTLRLQKMQEQYKNAKLSNEKEMDNVAALQMLETAQKEYRDMDRELVRFRRGNEIPAIVQLREKSLALSNQIDALIDGIIRTPKLFKINGIILTEEENTPSIAIINKKSYKKKGDLTKEFVLYDIQQDKVILEYTKGNVKETVALGVSSIERERNLLNKKKPSQN